MHALPTTNSDSCISYGCRDSAMNTMSHICRMLLVHRLKRWRVVIAAWTQQRIKLKRIARRVDGLSVYLSKSKWPRRLVCRCDATAYWRLHKRQGDLVHEPTTWHVQTGCSFHHMLHPSYWVRPSPIGSVNTPGRDDACLLHAPSLSLIHI